MPHHEDTHRIERILWLAGDHPSETLAKCYAAGIPPEKIYLTPNARGEGPLILSDKAHFESLRELVREYRADVLVIESPETNLQPGQDENSGPAVKFQVMTPLARLALEEKLVVIAIKHSNKSSVAHASVKYAGSRQWSASSRSLLRVLQTEDGRRYFGAINQANHAPANAVEFEITGVADERGELVGRATFVGIADKTISQLDSPTTQGRETKKGGATDLIRGLFWRRELVPGDELDELRTTYGYAERTWRRARDDLGLEWIGNQGWAWPANPCG